MLRSELARAEGELDDRCWTPPHGLQQWLQLTHEIENKSYIKKKISAEKQLQQAREAVTLLLTHLYFYTIYNNMTYFIILMTKLKVTNKYQIVTNKLYVT